MAEQVQGALNARQEDAPEVKQQAPSFASGILQKSIAERQKQDVAESARMQKLMDALDARKNMPFNPMLMRLAAGMLQPTKTGSFGESLGYAAAGMSEQAEKEFRQKQEDAKLRFELESKMAEQRQQALGRQASQDILGGIGFSEPPPSAPPPSPAVSAAGEAKVMSVEPPVIFERGDGTSIAPTQADKEVVFPPTEVAVSPVEKQPPAGGKISAGEKVFQDFAKSSFQDRANLKTYAPAAYEALMTEEKRREDLAKISRETKKNIRDIMIPLEGDGVKALLSPEENAELKKAIENRDEKTAKRILTSHNMPFNYVIEKGGDWRAKTAGEKASEIKSAEAESSLEMKDYRVPELGKDFYPMLPKDYADYRRSKLESPEALDKWLSTYRSKVEGQVVGSEERKAISEGQRIEQQELAKARAETRKGYFESAKLADKISRPAKNIYNLASDPIRSKALGLLENSTVGDAFLGVISQSGNTGIFNFNVPSIRDAVAKLQGSTPDERTKIMDSFQALARNYSELELNFTRMYLENQGQVTEGERKIVRDVSGGLANRRNIALAQAETLMQRAEFDKEVKSQLLAWEKKNPGKSIDEFQDSKQYTSLKNSLENNMDKIYNKYFSDSKSKTELKTESKAEPNSEGKPMSIIDRLKAEKAARGIK